MGGSSCQPKKRRVLVDKDETDIQDPVSVKVNKRRWTREENKVLLDAVHGKEDVDWDLIARKLPGRNKKLCLEHWRETVNPDVTSEWTAEWDNILREHVAIHGETNWDQVSLVTQKVKSIKMCKRRYQIHLKTVSTFSIEDDNFILEAHGRGLTNAEIAKALKNSKNDNEGRDSIKIGNRRCKLLLEQYKLKNPQQSVLDVIKEAIGQGQEVSMESIEEHFRSKDLGQFIVLITSYSSPAVGKSIIRTGQGNYRLAPANKKKSKSHTPKAPLTSEKEEEIKKMRDVLTGKKADYKKSLYTPFKWFGQRFKYVETENEVTVDRLELTNEEPTKNFRCYLARYKVSGETQIGFTEELTVYHRFYRIANSLLGRKVCASFDDGLITNDDQLDLDNILEFLFSLDALTQFKMKFLAIYHSVEHHNYRKNDIPKNIPGSVLFLVRQELHRVGVKMRKLNDMERVSIESYIKSFPHSHCNIPPEIIFGDPLYPMWTDLPGFKVTQFNVTNNIALGLLEVMPNSHSSRMTDTGKMSILLTQLKGNIVVQTEPKVTADSRLIIIPENTKFSVSNPESEQSIISFSIQDNSVSTKYGPGGMTELLQLVSPNKQKMLYIFGFKEIVKLSSFKMTSPSGPMVIKLFVNQSNIWNFKGSSNAEPTVEIMVKDKCEDKISLSSTKFEFVGNLRVLLSHQNDRNLSFEDIIFYGATLNRSADDNF